MPEAQEQLIALQQSIVNLQLKLSEAAVGAGEVQNAELNPNSDEAAIAATDAGQEALAAASELVDQVLTGIKELLHQAG